MLTVSQMVLRLFVALALGALMGLERELVGKEAGIRTAMLVAGGASIFAMTSLALPYILATSPSEIPDIIAHSGFLGVVSNIVVGIGFLGAGIIIKTQERVHGVTTAAVVWTTAAIGAVVGLGLLQFAAIAAILVSGLLYLLRKVGVYEHVRPHTEDYSKEP